MITEWPMPGSSSIHGNRPACFLTLAIVGKDGCSGADRERGAFPRPEAHVHGVDGGPYLANALLGFRAAAVGEHQQEFVAPVSRTQIVRSYGVRQPLGNRAQHRVASRVPLDVVNRFEAIQVEYHERE